MAVTRFNFGCYPVVCDDFVALEMAANIRRRDREQHHASLIRA